MSGAVLPIPLLVLAAVFAVLAALEWRRLPLCARMSVAVATLFVIVGVEHPGLTAADSAESVAGLPTAVLLAVARGLGAALLLISVLGRLRSRPAR